MFPLFGLIAEILFLLIVLKPSSRVSPKAKHPQWPELIGNTTCGPVMHKLAIPNSYLHRRQSTECLACGTREKVCLWASVLSHCIWYIRRVPPDLAVHRVPDFICHPERSSFLRFGHSPAGLNSTRFQALSPPPPSSPSSVMFPSFMHGRSRMRCSRFHLRSLPPAMIALLPKSVPSRRGGCLPVTIHQITELWTRAYSGS